MTASHRSSPSLRLRIAAVLTAPWLLMANGGAATVSHLSPFGETVAFGSVVSAIEMRFDAPLARRVDFERVHGLRP